MTYIHGLYLIMKIDARIAILSVLLLSVALGIANIRHLPGVLLIGGYIGIGYRKYFSQALWVVGGTVLFIFSVGLLSWLFASEISWANFILDSFRWIVLALSTFVLIVSMNLFECLAAMVYLKIPIRVAVALGVGVRFLPVITEEYKRISIVNRRNRQIGRSSILTKMDRLLSPFIVSVIRRIDSITLSIVTQQLENRIIQYEFSRLRTNDFIHSGICILFLIYVIIYS